MVSSCQKSCRVLLIQSIAGPMPMGSGFVTPVCAKIGAPITRSALIFRKVFRFMIRISYWKITVLPTICTAAACAAVSPLAFSAVAFDVIR